MGSAAGLRTQFPASLLLVLLPRMGLVVRLAQVGHVQADVVPEGVERLVSQGPTDGVEVGVGLDQFTRAVPACTWYQS